MTRPGPAALLRIELTFLAAVRLIVNSGHRLVYPFLPAISRGLGVSLGAAGFLVSARWAAGLSAPVIVTVTRRGEHRRRLMTLGVALFAVGAAVTAGTNVYLGALVGFVLMGIAKPVFDVAAQSYVADRTPYEVRARYLGVLELTWAGGLLIGAPAAGWLINRGGWTTPFWVIALLAAVALVAIPLTLESDAPVAGKVRAPLQWDVSSVAFMVTVGLFTAGAEVMFVVMGAWLEDEFGLSLVSLGGLATLIALAELTGEGLTVGFTDRLGKRRSVAIGMALAIVGFVLLAVFEASLVLGVAAMMFAYLGFEFTIVSAIPLATEIRPAARVRFLAWMVVAMSIGRTIGTAVGAPIFESLGVPGNALFAAAANIVGLVVFLGWVRERAGGDAVIAPQAG